MPKRLPVSRKALRGLSLNQLVELNGVVRQLIQNAREEEKREASNKRDVIKEKVRDNKTYRQIFTRCGKKNCKCTNDITGHGPYWYAFWSEQGKTKCKYIGKRLSKRKITDKGIT
jgi:hypothetical protein